MTLQTIRGYIEFFKTLFTTIVVVILTFILFFSMYALRTILLWSGSLQQNNYKYIRLLQDRDVAIKNGNYLPRRYRYKEYSKTAEENNKKRVKK